MPICETYGSDRVACATKVASTTGEVTVIAGLHHGEKIPLLRLPIAPGSRLTTTAEDVFDNSSDANLKAYVQGVIAFVQGPT